MSDAAISVTSAFDDMFSGIFILGHFLDNNSMQRVELLHWDLVDCSIHYPRFINNISDAVLLVTSNT